MLFLLLISLILCSSSLYLFFFFLRSCGLNRRTLGLLPPGNFGFPLVGETLQLISAYKTENPEPFIDSRVNKYGNLFTTHVFGEPTVFSTEHETNRFILHNEGKLFESSYHSSISNLLGKHSLSLMKGNLHKRMHSLAVSFANSSTIRDNLFVSIDELIRFNLDSWTDQVLLHEEAKKITFELTVKQLMSHDPGQWTDNLRREYLLLIDGFFSVPFPFFFTTYGRAIKARKKIAETLRTTVRKRRKECEKDDKMRQKDMLGALVHDEGGLSDKQIVDFLLSLLVAGHETTSTVMTLAVKFVSETPRALAQLKEEHDEIRRKNHNSEALQWSDYKSMAFTQCIINETLRVANIISGVFRRATTDVNIKGFTIPKGWKVFTSFRAVHLDEHNYKEARTFNPWRWQNNSASLSSHGNMFTPFGGGPRLCPGYELARVEICVFLHHFITNFSWTPTEEDKLVFFPTTRTLKRYPIHVYRRKKLKV